MTSRTIVRGVEVGFDADDAFVINHYNMGIVDRVGYLSVALMLEKNQLLKNPAANPLDTEKEKPDVQ